jgi:hypothetical protein
VETSRYFLLEGLDDAVETKPITALDRYVLQFIFDTQPERRKQYLKEKGWDVDPKDENRIRPLGTKGEFDTEIDPGGFFNVKQYLPKNASKDEVYRVATELFTDVNEGILDFLQGAVIEGAGVAGMVPGAAVGTAVGGPVGTVTGGTIGRSLGRAAMFQVMEQMKDQIGDYLTDTDNSDSCSIYGP